MTLAPLGDSAWVHSPGATLDRAGAQQVQALAAEWRRRQVPGLVDVVPAFDRIGLIFEPGTAAELAELQWMAESVRSRVEPRVEAEGGRTVEIPVCYGGEFGPDLPVVAAQAGLSEAEVIACHAGAEYCVHAIGFAPGFPYLGGLPAPLATPRRSSPRARVPGGSVGIGGAQTGIYPRDSPGGWNIIGRTGECLFDPRREAPALLRAGDRVRFRVTSPTEFSAKADVIADAEPRGEAGLEILRAGMQATVQDLGRTGYRADGVPSGGGADGFAVRVANLLVGNPEGAAGIECALVGPEMRFHRDTIVALVGAEYEGLPAWRPVAVKAGQTVKLGPARRGCRGFLAVAGGIDVRPVLGSRSTDLRAGFGGWCGRALRDGDLLPVGDTRRTLQGRWTVDPRMMPAFGEESLVRIVAGAQAAEFPGDWHQARFAVSGQSDRMGVRLAGPTVRRITTEDLTSAPVVPGTIQVPPDGQPIVLLADAQTIGGYPQIAHVVTVDLPVLAQLRPGDTVRFGEVTRADARALLAARERALARLREGLKEKWR